MEPRIPILAPDVLVADWIGEPVPASGRRSREIGSQRAASVIRGNRFYRVARNHKPPLCRHPRPSIATPRTIRKACISGKDCQKGNQDRSAMPRQVQDIHFNVCALHPDVSDPYHDWLSNGDSKLKRSSRRTETPPVSTSRMAHLTPSSTFNEAYLTVGIPTITRHSRRCSPTIFVAGVDSRGHDS